MANISLNKSVRTCKVNTGWADRIYSDRFQNSENIICPVWNGMDSAGRKVDANSFYTKYQGCQSANDRIVVENDLRPQYMEYVTLDASGIEGTNQGCCDQSIGVGESGMPASEPFRTRNRHIRENFDYKTNLLYKNAESSWKDLENIHKITGQFGQNNFRSWVQPTCPQYDYETAAAQCAQDNREQQAKWLGAESYKTRRNYR